MVFKEYAENLVTECLHSVKPDRVLHKVVQKNRTGLSIGGIHVGRAPVYVIGFGKAAALMAVTMENLLGRQCGGGYVITKYDHGLPAEKITIREAGHPIPDKNTLKYSGELLQFIQTIPREAVVCVLISGGGSALFEVLAPGISLSDLADLSDNLLGCGANIAEINTIRKHISRVKGGQLLREIAPRKSISLIISDVIGDPIEFIASGPTAPDRTTYADALGIVMKYGLEKKIPSSIRNHLQAGATGKLPENPSIDSKLFVNHKNIIVASNRLLLAELVTSVEKEGYPAIVLGDHFEGEAREVGKFMAGMAKSVLNSGLPQMPPLAIIWGGETTVTLKGKGKGGRNQELALSFAKEMWHEVRPFAFVALGSDGTDGPTDAAGAVVTPDVLQTARSQGLNPQSFLDNNDAYHFWETSGGLIKTGPTQTNVMDVNLLLVPGDKKKEV